MGQISAYALVAQTVVRNFEPVANVSGPPTAPSVAGGQRDGPRRTKRWWASGRKAKGRSLYRLQHRDALLVRYSALMDESGLAVAIGKRVRQERQARNWTLDHLTQVSGVSRRMIISVEQGEANPSVATLLKLSDALGIGLPALVEPPDVVELWDWTLAAGDNYPSEPHSAGTRELVHVHSGLLTIEVAGQRVDLQPGDAASFAGDIPHAYRNPGEHPVHFSLSVFEPGVGIPKGRS